MSITHLLEDFGVTRRGTSLSITDVSLEEERLEAFEKGYQAGWDDSVKSQGEESRRIAADLGQNLQDLSFTYEEAYAAVMQAVHPLLEQMVSAVLPRLARDSLVPRLVETLHDIAREQGHQKIAIAAAEADMPALAHLTEAVPEIDIELGVDDTLASGQIYLRFDGREQAIDMQEVLEGIEQAVSGFFENSRKATA
ncbi:flagellar biosynthesis protein [Roseovarius sp. D22-M7]|uniref:flagellar biosynthesis protein n=1 Tax=Roseovarius sp. D22-M7 TaxID=3127116 RepID=UPI00300FCAC0